MADELSIPPEAVRSNGFEVCRVWIAGDAQQIALRTDVWEDPAAWGLLLVDLARNVAMAHTGSRGAEYDAMLERIKEGFDAEWDAPTDEPGLN
jgi:hypothetical protein